MSWPVSQILQDWAQQNSKWKFYFEKEIGSTNTWAKESPEILQDKFSIYATDFQTAGRGRFDRTWTDPQPGSSLLASWCLQMPAAPQPIFTEQVGKILCQSISKTFPQLKFTVKSPNDLLLNEKKLAGLLIETISKGAQIRVIIGLGMNVWAKPKELPFSTCLSEHLPELSKEDFKSFLTDWKENLNGLTTHTHL